MMLADDPTAAAVLAAVPCYPVPPSGGSPAIDALLDARAGHGLLVGRDGVILILRRPWLELDMPLTPPLLGHVPYGTCKREDAELRCGLIPGRLLAEITRHFVAALPNEAAAFVAWHETERTFDLIFPAVDQASPSRLVYRPPVLGPDWHLVADVHSHGRGPAFFSATDDTDDAHTTKIALVVGNLGHPEGPVMVGRLCAVGLFIPLPRSPFAEGGDDD